jgi:hypothetical protein
LSFFDWVWPLFLKAENKIRWIFGGNDGRSVSIGNALRSRRARFILEAIRSWWGDSSNGVAINDAEVSAVTHASPSRVENM